MKTSTNAIATSHETSTTNEPPAFATDSENRIVFWNREAELLLAVPARQALGRTPDAILCRPELRGRFRMSTLRIPAAGGETKVYLLRPAADEADRRTRRTGAEAAPPCPLSTREKEIMELLSNGYASINIAARLDLSHATIRNHIQNTLRKLKVHGQVEAVALAFRSGWIPLPKPASNVYPMRSSRSGDWMSAAS